MEDTRRDELMLQMAADLAEIKTKISADYRALYGNGHPGLIEKHERLEDRVLKLEELKKTVWALIGLLVTAAGAIVSLVKK